MIQGIEQRYYIKYHGHLNNPDYFPYQMSNLVGKINQTKEVALYNQLVDELDALGEMYSLALQREQKREDERRLKEFYEVLISD